MNSKINICIWLLTFAFQATVVGQITKEEVEKFVLVIKLDDDRIQSLRVHGALKTKVPDAMVNRVAAIRFQKPSSFLDKTVRVEARTDKRSRTLATRIDNSILDRIAYQPVEMKIYDSGFSSVLVVLDQPLENSLETIQGQLATPPQGPNDSPSLFVRISDTRGIEGTLKDLKELNVTTNFGEIKIALSNLSGIRCLPNLELADHTNVFVVSKTGDYFSGSIHQKLFVVQSRWGEKELKFSEIESLTLAPSARFVPDTAAEGQWKLVQKDSRPETTNPRLSPNKR